MCSLGGAAGGLFVAWFAPSVFNALYEFPIAIGACALLILYVTRRRDAIWFACAALSCVLVFYLAKDSYEVVKGARVLARNFYGALRVNDSEGSGSVPPTRQLTHGTINHGEQFLESELRRRPTTYYGFTSGVGLAIRELQGDAPMNVGVVGLGTGTLASYGRPGDYYRVYEINPLVLEIARRDFFFLHDCLARLDVALGDARLSLEREPSRHFDVLAIDAFSGDSIPIHLLTREAFALYRRHLKPDGVLAVHVSNKFLDLAPVVQAGADSVGKQARMVINDESESEVVFSSDWVLVTSRPGFFDTPLLQGKSTTIPDWPGFRPWTDDYSNLWQILR
ncbi:MAG: fused MFS/spermidine synthase [Acidobacteriota bacterium]|nr:fused MFS/spermidine synthase [Acidobacteriota bacterium]